MNVQLKAVGGGEIRKIIKIRALYLATSFFFIFCCYNIASRRNERKVGFSLPSNRKKVDFFPFLS